MAYIGKEPIVGNFQVCDAISVVNGQAAYTMQVSSTNVVPESANHMLVSLNGILQKPGSSFTVSGSTITFASALSTGDVIDFIMLLGNVLDLGVPSDATVTDAKANFVSTSSGAGLQIKGDGTTDGTLQLNCSQNSHGIKLKSPAHSTSSSYTLTFPGTDPSADKFLKTDGSGNLSFADAGGGDMVKISTSSLSSASSWYTDSLDSTYFAYKIIVRITDISTQYAKIYARLRNSGSDLTGSNYTWSCGGWFRYTDNTSGNGELKDGYAGGTAWSPHGEGGLDTDDGEGINMEIDLFEPSSTSGFKKGLSYSTFLYDSARWYTVMGSFKYASQSAYTGFKLYTSAGTMTGTVNLYGIK